jgi:hypothetical protein
VAKLEARRPPGVDDYTPPEPPPGWYEEVLRLLWQYGHLESVLQETFELPEEEVARLMEMAASDFAAFVAAFEETPADAFPTHRSTATPGNPGDD